MKDLAENADSPWISEEVAFNDEVDLIRGLNAGKESFGWCAWAQLLIVSWNEAQEIITKLNQSNSMILHAS